MKWLHALVFVKAQCLEEQYEADMAALENIFVSYKRLRALYSRTVGGAKR